VNMSLLLVGQRVLARWPERIELPLAKGLLLVFRFHKVLQAPLFMGSRTLEPLRWLCRECRRDFKIDYKIGIVSLVAAREQTSARSFLFRCGLVHNV
jgi:hypothetical protein